ncbi:sulfatase-like hydrolase/transferase [Mesorhizobium sp. 113-3-9]|uniref:sulfatase-like hydrolase/transferase n=1 Tax=Mesorhizobium sp. 113-3-9 TaxID=2744517 RepID=UPI0019255CEB|nr:sulfatase-like hydrolase/transferase [Mesorhizobium sp. 113-3-9]
MIAIFVAVTNFDFWDRVGNLFANGRFTTLAPFLAIWGLAMVALLFASFQPRLVTRLLWAVPLALSSAAAWVYFQVSHADLSVFDILSLWASRNSIGEAAGFYDRLIWPAVAIMAFGVTSISIPPAVTGARLSIWVRRMAWLPLLPILIIAAVVYAKDGGGSSGLPKQFAPLALSAMAAERIVTQGAPERRAVTWNATAQARPRNIVMMIDESVRADFVDLSPGNSYTPNIAALADRFVDFGPAVSGGDCSVYSNAILRLTASRRDLAHSVNTNPTIWQYAKKAGYRTVYIDAQSTAKAAVLLGSTNFMTVREKRDIDKTYFMDDVRMDRADFRLIDILRGELAGSQPVFIYANKNGAHFPYDWSYPASEAVYGPTVASAGKDTAMTRLASYRNAVRWSVDLFMKKLFESADLSNTAMIYTSDHGQALNVGKSTHCTIYDPDPRVGLVPLMAYAADPALRARFAVGAAANRDKASHFQIVPTVLELMGYSPADIASEYDESLFAATSRSPQFTSGDIFGLFSDSVHWNSIDLSLNYLEPDAQRLLPDMASAKADGP